MAKELSPSQSGARGVRRIARKEIARALKALGAKNISDEEVHAARRRLKKARAALRLLRDVLGKARYTRENTALRDAARPLSEMRDARVLLDTLDGLVERYGATVRILQLDRLRRTLRRGQIARRRSVLGRPGALKPQYRELRKLHKRAGRWPVGRKGWSVLGPCLKKVYAKGRKARAAAQTRSPEALHEWRKQAKYLRAQWQILRPLRPALIGELTRQAHELTDSLGEDHDLLMLRAQALQNTSAFSRSTDRTELVALIDRCRTELEDRAMIVGRRLYAEKPGKFERRFGRYWWDWRGGA